jgi:hypothetical protein
MIKIQPGLPDTETRQVSKTDLQIEPMEQIERVKEWAITWRKQK